MAKNRRAKLAKRVQRAGELKSVAVAEEVVLEVESDHDEDEMKNVLAALSVQTQDMVKALEVTEEEGKKKAPTAGTVIYVGHIPFGFFEREMKSFFEQFGAISRLRLARNPKTKKSRHYAFVEFESDEVAKIVAESMNGYMMFGRSLVCHVVVADKIHDDMFKGAFHAGRQYTNCRDLDAAAAPEVPVVRTMEQHDRKVKDLVGKSARKQQRIKEMGMDYVIPAFVQQVAVATADPSITASS